MKITVHAAKKPNWGMKGLDGHVSWNGYNYARKRTKDGEKYYKCKTARFDDSMGGTVEVSPEEYFEVAEKYSRVMGSKSIEGVRLTDSWSEDYRSDINSDVATKTFGDCEATIVPFDDYEGTTGYNVIIQNKRLQEIYENSFENPGALGKAKRWANRVMSEYVKSSKVLAGSDEMGYDFPEQILVNGKLYTKIYEHDGGGCYYRTEDPDVHVMTSEVSLYPDGRVTYLWNGMERPYKCDWEPVEACNITSSKKVQANETWDKIGMLEKKIEQLKETIAEGKAAGDDMIDEQMYLAELEDELRFAWADDEAEYNYALEQQEFNPDGSLKGYGDVYSSTSFSVPDEVPTLDFDDSDTLFQVLHHFMDEAEEGDFYTRVRVLLNSNDKELYNGSSLEEAEEQLDDWLSYPTESSWIDDRITIVILDNPDEYTPSSSAGDYGPSNPWDAPGMSIRDFI